MSPNGIMRGLSTKVMLLTSLCLNVAMGTFIATRWVETDRELVNASAPPRLIERATQRLPKADADILRGVYRTKEAEFAALQRQYWRALLAAGRVLAQPELDPATFRAAVEDARNKRVEIGDLAIETFIEGLPQMSPEGRRALISGIRRR